jgi:hypothetical protein
MQTGWLATGKWCVVKYRIVYTSGVIQDIDIDWLRLDGKDFVDAFIESAGDASDIATFKTNAEGTTKTFAYLRIKDIASIFRLDLEALKLIGGKDVPSPTVPT